LTFVTFLSAIGCSPDAGQPDPPGPLAKHEEAQLSELCLEFFDLVSRSLTNMACRSSGMSLDTTTKIRCNPVSRANQPHSFRQHLCLALLQKCSCLDMQAFVIICRAMCHASLSACLHTYLVGHSLLVQLHNIIE